MSEKDEIVSLLVVDDDKFESNLLKRHLRLEGYTQVDVAENGQQALQMLHSKNFDLVLLDIAMPKLDGFGVLERLKGDNRLRKTPVIMISGLEDIDSVVKCIEMGAEDHLPKPFNPILLRARIGASLEKKRLTDELEKKNELLANNNEKLRDLAVRDQMTKLYNHAEFQRTLDQRIKWSRRDSSPFCFALGNIDDFKHINDTYGHPVGDRVIKEVAEICVASHRGEVDTVFRYGGEEFAIIFGNTNEKESTRALDRMLRRIRTHECNANGRNFRFTMSFGLGEYFSEWSKEEYLRLVDQALYRAKRGGKNRYVVLSDQLHMEPSGKEIKE